jgi:hypothetical protein
MTQKLSQYENGQYELAAQFTNTGRPEIFEGDTK